MARATPKVVDLTLSYQNGKESISIVVGTPAWFAWLDRSRLFAVADTQRTFTMRKERRRNGWYWYAYAKRDGKLHRCYIGRSCDVTMERLEYAQNALFRAETPPYPKCDLAHFLLESDNENSDRSLDTAAVRRYLAAAIIPDVQQPGGLHHQQLAELAALLVNVIEEERCAAAIIEEQLRQEAANVHTHQAHGQSHHLWGQSTCGEVF